MKALLLLLPILPVMLVAAPQNPTPRDRVGAVIAQLQSDRAPTAFADFFKDSLMASQKETLLRAMDGQAKGAFEFYGKPKTYEILSEEKFGENLVRIKWLTKHNDEVPMFWNCLFYLRKGRWEALSIVFNDSPQTAGI